MTWAGLNFTCLASWHFSLDLETFAKHEAKAMHNQVPKVAVVPGRNSFFLELSNTETDW